MATKNLEMEAKKPWNPNKINQGIGHPKYKTKGSIHNNVGSSAKEEKEAWIQGWKWQKSTITSITIVIYIVGPVPSQGDIKPQVHHSQ